MALSNATIGRGVLITPTLIKDAGDELQTTPINPAFLSEIARKANVPYYTLEHRNISKTLIDLWVQDPSNITRAESAVGRCREKNESGIVKSWSVIRTKLLQSPGKVRAGIESKTTIIFLAVKDFSLKDVKMENGEDICLDGDKKIVFPGKSGSLAIMFELDL